MTTKRLDDDERERINAALTALQKKHRPFLCRLIQNLGVREFDTGSVVQDVLLKAARRLGRGVTRPFVTRKWLAAVARNVVKDYFRTREREERRRRYGPRNSRFDEQVRRTLGDLTDVFVTLDAEARRATEAVSQARLRAILREIARLDGREKKIVRWHGLEGRPFTEIAGRLRLSAKTVSRVYRAALTKLRRELKDFQG